MSQIQKSKMLEKYNSYIGYTDDDKIVKMWIIVRINHSSEEQKWSLLDIIGK